MTNSEELVQVRGVFTVRVTDLERAKQLFLDDVAAQGGVPPSGVLDEAEWLIPEIFTSWVWRSAQFAEERGCGFKVVGGAFGPHYPPVE